MVPTRRRPSAECIKCLTVHSVHISATSHRVWWLRRMASTFTSPEPTGLFSVGIHKTASVCNNSTNIAETSKLYYGCLCQRVTCHVVQCAAGSAVPCPDVYCC
ncbi:hypothetical protein AVEN_154417-1 [Araneus ventricosus]|uniref:Uncharacterized protein n=1 Tax=Araneus ventricosus TaxID=182803 RepID=A0A4Y2VCQ4_ARAVE|nr:hypothetical protein AVEN_227803-1 [Araneus ventricosus]GBO22371.1 hypothetical protein AVEN_154417-1 [Araneus ventricosus]